MTEHVVLTPRDDIPLAKRIHDRDAVRTLFGADGTWLADPPAFGWTASFGSRRRGWCGTVDRVRVIHDDLREIIDGHLGPDDALQWIPCHVVEDGVPSDRWSVMHFPTRADLLDHDATTMGPSGLPIRWVLSRERIASRRVFGLVGIQDQVVVERGAFAAIKAAGLADGLRVSRARVV